MEVSPCLTQVQKETLSTQPREEALVSKPSSKPSVVSKVSEPLSVPEPFVSKHGIPVSWYRNIEEVPAASSGFDAFVANEFFDALPVHKFQKNEKGIWNEIMVDFDSGSGSDSGSDSGSRLRFIVTPGETPASKVYIKVSCYL